MPARWYADRFICDGSTRNEIDFSVCVCVLTVRRILQCHVISMYDSTDVIQTDSVSRSGAVLYGQRDVILRKSMPGNSDCDLRPVYIYVYLHSLDEEQAANSAPVT